jgi:hypothetical protein
MEETNYRLVLTFVTSGNQHTFNEVRPRKDHHGVDLISDALPFGGLWYPEPNAVCNAASNHNRYAVVPATCLVVAMLSSYA